jgi:hypothetical protein
MAAEFTIVQGQLTHDHEYIQQPIGVTNNGAAEIESLEVECGFLRGDVLLATGFGFAEHIRPHQTAYLTVHASHADSSDKAECRAVQ